MSSAPSRSAIADSPMPKALTERTASGGSPNRAASRGRTCSLHMRRISEGTPGMSATIAPSRSTHQPGAEPIGLGSVSADGTSIACRRLAARHRPEGTESLLQRREQRRVLDRLLAQRIGEPFAGQVVMRRTQAAGRQHDRRASQSIGECVAQDSPVVGQHPDGSKRQAEGRQLLAEECRVRVHGLAEEELGANGEQLDGGHSARV